MNPVIKQQLEKAHSLHMAGKLSEAEMLYNSVLNLEMQNSRVLYLLANVYAMRGFHGLAVNLLTNCLDIEPDFQAAWIDLGVSLRKENKDELARTAWERARQIRENPEIDNNMATLYADCGEPEKAIEYSQKALKELENDDKTYDDVRNSAHWNMALALLALGRWKEGWKEHFFRRKLPDVWNERTKIDAPLWDGSPVDILYIHGEQGKGDEIMYLSMLNDVLPKAKKIVLEVNEAVGKLVKMLDLPTVTVVNTQDEAAHIKFDAKIALGDLGAFCRNTDNDFPGTPYLKADPERVDFYRKELNKLGPGPYVGIAWMGGTKHTRVHKRSVGLGKWDKLLDGITAVSIQYGEFNEPEATKYGIPILGEASRGTDLAEQAALIEACDFVISVQGTTVHLSGALGKKCYVLTSEAPSWRYGVRIKTMPWYNSVELIRQAKGESWESVLSRATDIVHIKEGVETRKAAVK